MVKFLQTKILALEKQLKEIHKEETATRTYEDECIYSTYAMRLSADLLEQKQLLSMAYEQSNQIKCLEKIIKRLKQKAE